MAVPHPPVIRTVAGSALAAILVLSSACAQRADAPEEDGERKVVIACGATEEWCGAMKSAFTKATGIEAEYVRLSSGEALARIKSRKDNPEFDIWHGGPADGYAAAGSELLEPYKSPNAAAIPFWYKDPAALWTGVYVGLLGFCSNAKILAAKRLAAPQSWKDLLSPGLRKGVGIAHPSTSGTAYTALWTHVTLNGGDKNAAFGYLRQLHPNILQYSKSGSGPIQQVVRGEIAAAVVFSHDCEAAKEAGARDVQISFPAEGTGYEIGGVALIKGARHPKYAKQYVDWALTPAAQELGAVAAKAYQVPAHPDAKRHDKVPDLKTVKLVEYDAVAAGREKSLLTKRFEEEVALAPK